MEIIKLKNINKKFPPNLNVLNDISFTVNENEFIMIVGKSGCGKSTLLNILGLVDMPTQGEYLYKNINIETLSEAQKAHIRLHEIGFIFQSFYLIDELNVIENVALPLGYSGIKRNDRINKAYESLKTIGIEHKAYEKVSKLSGGEQQRVAIARSIINNPVLLLSDEPTGNLDIHNREQVMQILSNLHKRGNTIIMVTHDNDLLSYATRIINIKDGKLYTY